MLAQFIPQWDDDLAQFSAGYLSEQGNSVVIDGFVASLGIYAGQGEILSDVIISSEAQDIALISPDSAVISSSITNGLTVDFSLVALQGDISDGSSSVVINGASGGISFDTIPALIIDGSESVIINGSVADINLSPSDGSISSNAIINAHSVIITLSPSQGTVFDGGNIIINGNAGAITLASASGQIIGYGSDDMLTWSGAIKMSEYKKPILMVY